MRRLQLNGTWPDGGLFLLRVFFGATMALAHGWPKAQQFAELRFSFPDPLGLGSQTSLVLVVFAELVCAAAVTAGVFFRLALLPLMVTMIVAGFMIHGHDPFQKQELAFTYLAAYTALLFMGPGRYSVDAYRG